MSTEDKYVWTNCVRPLVPRLLRKVQLHIAKCCACHSKCSYTSPSTAPVTQKATAPTASPENQARHQSQPSAISAISATQSAVKGMPTFEISSPTWVNNKDVALNKSKQIYKSNQSIPKLSHIYNTHIQTTRRRCLCSCCYIPC